jgi:hypothetical protein
MLDKDAAIAFAESGDGIVGIGPEGGISAVGQSADDVDAEAAEAIEAGLAGRVFDYGIDYVFHAV